MLSHHAEKKGLTDWVSCVSIEINTDKVIHLDLNPDTLTIHSLADLCVRARMGAYVKSLSCLLINEDVCCHAI